MLTVAPCGWTLCVEPYRGGAEGVIGCATLAYCTRLVRTLCSFRTWVIIHPRSEWNVHWVNWLKQCSRCRNSLVSKISTMQSRQALIQTTWFSHLIIRLSIGSGARLYLSIIHILEVDTDSPRQHVDSKQRPISGGNNWSQLCTHVANGQTWLQYPWQQR